MKRHIRRGLLVCACLLPVLSGCTGTHSFSMAARAGDTVTVTVGWSPDATRETLGIQITDAGGGVTVYPPGDSRIRAVMNLYPDPVSYLVVADATGRDIRPNDHNFGAFARGPTDGDNDLSVTTVFLDLPDSMALGEASLRAKINGKFVGPSSKVNITGTGGVSNPLTIFEFSGSNIERVQSLERAPHYTVALDGSTVPNTVELELTHDPTDSAGGTGRVHVANPRGDIKSLAWADDGLRLKILLTPAKTQNPPGVLKDFKLHVAGGVTGLKVARVATYNADGVPVAGVTAGIAPLITSLAPGSSTFIILGRNLCKSCVTAGNDPKVRLFSGGKWQQAAVQYATENSIFAQAPSPPATGDTVRVDTPFGTAQREF